MVFANGFHMGNPYGGLYVSYMDSMWDMYGAYIGPLLHSCKSDELKIGPMWALNNIPVIKVGTI